MVRVSRLESGIIASPDASEAVYLSLTTSNLLIQQAHRQYPRQAMQYKIKPVNQSHTPGAAQYPFDLSPDVRLRHIGRKS